MKDKPPAGVGNLLVRLSDVPLDDRLTALRLVLHSCKDEEEALALVELVLDPGEAGGRIAA